MRRKEETDIILNACSLSGIIELADTSNISVEAALGYMRGYIERDLTEPAEDDSTLTDLANEIANKFEQENMPEDLAELLHKLFIEGYKAGFVCRNDMAATKML